MVFTQEPVTRLFGLAAGLHIKSQRIVERELRTAGLTYAQFGLLAALSEKNGRTQREIADQLETDANTVMVILGSLEKKGLVERRPDPSDGRKRRVHLLRAGARRLEAGLRIVEALYSPLAGLISSKQVQQALPVLERLYARVRELESSRGVRR